MIRRVSSSIESFKTAEFGPGLNLMLAERAPGSGEKDSRNGVGKSLLIEIIQFCLGSSFRSDAILSRPVLKDKTFTLEFQVGEVVLKVTRNTGDAPHVELEGAPEDWLHEVEHEPTLLGAQLSVTAYTRMLGRHVFGVPQDVEGVSHAPTFRALANFVARYGGGGAFISPFTTHQTMSAAEKQILNTFLLGIGWEYALQWQQWRDESEAIKNLKRAVKGGALEGLGRSVGELEPEKVRLSAELKRVKQDLDRFRVHPEYESIEREANRLTRDMQRDQNEIIANRELLRMYEDSLEEEADADPGELVQLFEEAGVVLGEAVKKRLEDVRAFHASVVANRREFLRGEIARLRAEIDGRAQTIQTHDTRRSELLGILQTHGALKEHSELHQLALDLGAKLASVEQQIKHLSDIDRRSNELKLRQADLVSKTLADFQDRAAARDEAISIFNENSEHLYNAPGKLIINIGENGYDFRVTIEREGSEGIEKMKIFCYDLMLARLWASRTPSPKLLIHDSTIFDGVDERQRGHALQRAFHEANDNGFQYIACFNTDAIPDQSHMPDIDVEAHTRLKLDDTETGSLLGFRF